jgi:hypothetical protein
MLPSAIQLSPPFSGQPLFYMGFGVLLAVALCWVRSKFQILYGMVEIATGLFLMALSMEANGGAFSNDFSNAFDVFHYTLKVTTYLGAIFVMVRGCDNIKQGITKLKNKSKAPETLVKVPEPPETPPIRASE